MADRQVTNATRNDKGDIVSLSHPGQTRSPRSVANIIRDIDARDHTYFVNWKGIGRTEIRVVHASYDTYLRTDHDATPKNNLDELPEP